MINIQDLNKADVLAALYNASRPLGMGFLHYASTPMTSEAAEAEFGVSEYFDYLHGRVMKICLKGDDFREDLYDRDNGDGAAMLVIDSLRLTGDVNNEIIQKIHKDGLTQAALQAMNRLHQETRMSEGVVTLGLAHAANELEPKIRQALS